MGGVRDADNPPPVWLAAPPGANVMGLVAHTQFLALSAGAEGGGARGETRAPLEPSISRRSTVPAPLDERRRSSVGRRRSDPQLP